MTRSTVDPEDLLRRLEPQPAPDDLRQAVLPAARQALVEPVQTDIWMTLWQSPGLRLVWGLAVLILLIGNVLVTPERQPRHQSEETMTIALARSAGGELGELTSLPTLQLEPWTWVGEPGVSNRPSSNGS